MRNLVLLFLRFGHILLFLVLEAFCLYLVVNYNRRQRDIWINSTNIFSGYTAEKTNDWSNYLSLDEEMEKLATENAKLREKLINYGLRPAVERDSFFIKERPQYELQAAKVVNTSTDRPNNFITLNKGTADWVQKDMGVICDKGIVGIIRSVNDEYAVANSLLHRRSFISASIKRTGAYGVLRWLNSNPRFVNLTAIESHHNVMVGDTIVTSAFSTHFPAGIMVGVVEKSDLPSGSSFHEIEVKLSTDFSALNYVYIIDNQKQQQQLDLEKEVMDE
ncbi:MAG: rod shape-determining protein MreC [Bacteroidota bacterium]